MTKIKLKFSDMFCRLRIKTVTDALTGLKSVQRAKMNLHEGRRPSALAPHTQPLPISQSQ